MKATKMQEPAAILTDRIEHLAQWGKAVVKEGDGSWSVIGTTSKTDRPRREKVLLAKTFEAAVREACE